LRSLERITGGLGAGFFRFGYWNLRGAGDQNRTYAYWRNF